MVKQFFVIVALVSFCQAVPIWFEGEDGDIPGVILRVRRSPDSAFGFGSGFSSNIGGIRHSTGMGAAFQTGDAEAFGAGFGMNNGYSQAGGLGFASAGPSRYQRPSNNGGGSRPYGSAASSAQSYGPGRHHTATASAENGSNGAWSAQANAENDYGTATSSANVGNGQGYYNTAVAAAENYDGYRASTAQAVRQRGSSLQHSGASSINAPGIQAAHSHAVNTGYY